MLLNDAIRSSSNADLADYLAVTKVEKDKVYKCMKSCLDELATSSKVTNSEIDKLELSIKSTDAGSIEKIRKLVAKFLHDYDPAVVSKVLELTSLKTILSKDLLNYSSQIAVAYNQKSDRDKVLFLGMLSKIGGFSSTQEMESVLLIKLEEDMKGAKGSDLKELQTCHDDIDNMLSGTFMTDVLKNLSKEFSKTYLSELYKKSGFDTFSEMISFIRDAIESEIVLVESKVDSINALPQAKEEVSKKESRIEVLKLTPFAEAQIQDIREELDYVYKPLIEEWESKKENLDGYIKRIALCERRLEDLSRIEGMGPMITGDFKL